MLRFIDDRFRVAALGLLLAGVAALGGCQQNNRPAIPPVPPSRAGEAPKPGVVEEAEQLNTAVQAAAVKVRDINDYFTAVAQRLLEAAGKVDSKFVQQPIFKNAQFVLVDNPRPVAVAPGGRYIYVYTGLLQQCQTEDDLAAAMAHAYAHTVRLDNERWQQKAIDPAARGSRLDQVVFYHFVWPDQANGGQGYYTAKQEAEAAQTAFAIYAQGGWDPAAFNRLPTRGGAGGGARTADNRLRRSPEADPASFASIKQQAEAGGRVTGPAVEYLAVLPACYGPAIESPERQQVATAIWKRIEPPPPPPPVGGPEQPIPQ